ncbi:pullulanase [Serratia ureilytica]
MTLKNIATAFMACLLLSGCQHAAKSVPDAAIQRDQLSSLVGVGQFLRERCNRADIPANDPLAAAALQAAERKGWAPALNRTQLLDAGKTSPRSWRPTPRRCKRSAADSTERWRRF